LKACPKGLHVPENCVVGITVKSKKDEGKIKSLDRVKGSAGTVISCLDEEETEGSAKGRIKYVEFLTLKGGLDDMTFVISPNPKGRRCSRSRL